MDQTGSLGGPQSPLYLSSIAQKQVFAYFQILLHMMIQHSIKTLFRLITQLF